METVTINEIYNILLDVLKNNFNREELIKLLVAEYLEDLDGYQIIDLYEKLCGNLDGIKVVV